MKCLLLSIAILFTTLVLRADDTPGKRPSLIQWKPRDCSKPLLLPKDAYDASQFGKGKYRIDTAISVGHFNNIYIIFQATKTLTPPLVDGASQSSFTVKDQTFTWRTFKTVVEGHSVFRKEAIMPNLLPHEKKDTDSEYIWIRMDADSQHYLDQLTLIAESVIHDAA